MMFFLKDVQSIENLAEIFNTFSLFGGTETEKMRNSRNRGPERGSSCSLWYEVQ